MRARWTVTVVLVAGVLVACQFPAGPRSSSALDAWYRAPPTDGDLYWTWRALDEAWLHEVVEDQQEEAQALLADAALVELTAEQAAEFVGQPLPDAPGTRPYLVRALYRTPETGRFEAFVQGERLVVYHGSLGSGSSPLQRRALVLQLEQEPSEVYVYAQTAK